MMIVRMYVDRRDNVYIIVAFYRSRVAIITSNSAEWKMCCFALLVLIGICASSFSPDVFLSNHNKG